MPRDGIARNWPAVNIDWTDATRDLYAGCLHTAWRRYFFSTTQPVATAHKAARARKPIRRLAPLFSVTALLYGTRPNTLLLPLLPEPGAKLLASPLLGLPNTSEQGRGAETSAGDMRLCRVYSCAALLSDLFA